RVLFRSAVNGDGVVACGPVCVVQVVQGFAGPAVFAVPRELLAPDHLMPSRSRYLRIADSSTFLMGRLSSRAMSVSARAMTVGPYARSLSMSIAASNSSWLVSWR